MKKYKSLLITVAAMLAIGLSGVANSQPPVDFGGSGGVDIQAFETNSAVNTTATIPYDFDRGVMVLTKFHASEYFAITGTAKCVFRFRIYSYDDGLHRTEPEAFSVSAIDAFRSGEKIQIKVYKESDPANAKWSSAISPASANVALKPVVDGDVIYVEVRYPTGFLPGYTGSGYLLRWALFNTGWVK